MSEMFDFKNYQWRKMAKNGEKWRKMAMANLPFSFVKFAISPLAPPRYQVFALQNGGWCASSPTAQETYNKLGTSSSCAVDGEGGPLANQVYKILRFGNNLMNF